MRRSRRHRGLRGSQGALLLCISAAASPVGCGQASAPNLLLVVVDTLRADRLGCYGWSEPTSPHVDRLASEGVLFEGMHAQAPQTQPSFASILTGTHPPTHGVRANGIFRLGPEALTLAEILRERGYRTGAVVAGFPLDSRFGLDQGFETYVDEMTWHAPMLGLREDEQGDLQWMGHETRNFESSADAVTDEAIAWLRGSHQDPFLLLVHYFDPHQDYLPPEELAERFSHPYAGEVAKVDRELGRLLAELEALGRSRDTLVAFTADHGECLGEQGRYNHQPHLAQAAIHVPFILRLPGALPAGRRVEGLCRSVDILPTLLELMELELPPGVEGVSLRPAIQKGSTGLRLAYFETLWGRLEKDHGLARKGISDGEWKLIHQGLETAERDEEGFELYDLRSDPEEARNLMGREPERFWALRALLETFLAAHPARKGELVTPDPELRRRLEALGYL